MSLHLALNFLFSLFTSPSTDLNSSAWDFYRLCSFCTMARFFSLRISLSSCSLFSSWALVLLNLKYSVVRLTCFLSSSVSLFRAESYSEVFSSCRCWYSNMSSLSYYLSLSIRSCSFLFLSLCSLLVLISSSSSSAVLGCRPYFSTLLSPTPPSCLLLSPTGLQLLIRSLQLALVSSNLSLSTPLLSMYLKCLCLSSMSCAFLVASSCSRSAIQARACSIYCCRRCSSVAVVATAPQCRTHSARSWLYWSMRSRQQPTRESTWFWLLMAIFIICSAASISCKLILSSILKLLRSSFQQQQ